jgi:histidinol-phosphate aminotransferase
MMRRLHGDSLAQDGLLDFAVNVWPARPPDLERTLLSALRDVGRYPNEAGARAALAARHGRTPDEVLLLNGAAEAFWLLANALRPATAVVVHPSFTETEAAFVAAGTAVTRLFREPERWTFDSVPDAELVVYGNPNNPTGGIDRPLETRSLRVVDGSFADFVPFDPPGDIVVRSLTKMWSLAGIRAGYLLGPADIVAALEAQRQPWSVNVVACAALEACAADAETPRHVAEEVAELREHLRAGLRELGIRVWPSSANFLLLQLADGPRVVEKLRGAGIAVRPCSDFPGLDDRYIRVAVRPRDDNTRLLQALAEIL